MTLYERIENLRKNKGISQKNMEIELGFSNGSISKWRNSKPTTERLQKIADYFGVSLEYLTTGEEKEQKEAPAISAEAQEFISLYESAPTEAREFVTSILKRSIQVSSPQE